MIDYNDDEKLICPYCGMEQRDYGDEEISSDMMLHECDSCGKDFWYSVDVKRTYSAREY